MGSHQDRLCLFYLRDGLVTNKLGKAVKSILVLIYCNDNSYLFFPRYTQKFNRLYRNRLDNFSCYRSAQLRSFIFTNKTSRSIS
jgi:hypothetical protein